MYRSTTEMALQVTTPAVLDIASVVQGFLGDEASITTEMTVITSGELGGRLVDELRLGQDPKINDLLEDPEGRPILLEELRGSIFGEELENGDAEPAPAEDLTPEMYRNAIIAVRRAISIESDWNT